MEMSIICSNLARGCEKQYLFEEMEGFQKLAEFFRRKAEPEAPANVQAILERINGDLSERYPAASDAASMEPDRGALRALVWSEKVTRMLQSLLARYETQGDRMSVRFAVLFISETRRRSSARSARFRDGGLKRKKGG